jgi:tetratricopeptide (TPR) repeat protein
MKFFVFLPPKIDNKLFKITSLMMTTVKSILLTTLTVLGLSILAQDLNQAGETFNQAIQFTKDKNYAEALNSYKKTIEICDQLGDEGIDLKMKAEQQLPSTYYNIAKGNYEGKQYNDAIANFDLAATWADQMGETKTADAARTYLAGIYTAVGNSDYKKEEYEKALENYNKAIEYKPDYFKAYYSKGITYRKMGKFPEMKDAIDKVLELAPDDDKTAGKARSVAATTFLNEGAIALQNGSNDDAVSNLTTSIEYDSSAPMAHYYLALAYNGKAEYANAIASASKSIELGIENSGDAWFAIGQANEAKGDTAAACEAYKKVANGPNVDAAKYQMQQVLKCN